MRVISIHYLRFIVVFRLLLIFRYQCNILHSYHVEMHIHGKFTEGSLFEYLKGTNVEGGWIECINMSYGDMAKRCKNEGYSEVCKMNTINQGGSGTSRHWFLMIKRLNKLGRRR